VQAWPHNRPLSFGGEQIEEEALITRLWRWSFFVPFALAVLWDKSSCWRSSCLTSFTQPSLTAGTRFMKDFFPSFNRVLGDVIGGEVSVLFAI
jgi:hypothetical protein